MAKAKIVITGEIETYRLNQDDTVSVIVKADTSENVPKGLKELGPSNYKININQKMWKKVSDNLDNHKILISGEPKATVNQKGVPFTIVNCFDISIIQPKEPQVKEALSQPKKQGETAKPKEPENNTKPINTKSRSIQKSSEKAKIKNDLETIAFGYFRKKHENDRQNIKVSDLILTEKEHFKTFKLMKLRTNANKSPLIVRPVNDSQYSLVSGFASYVVLKILNVETATAILTNLTRQEIMDQALAELKALEEERKNSTIIS